MPKITTIEDWKKANEQLSKELYDSAQKLANLNALLKDVAGSEKMKKLIVYAIGTAGDLVSVGFNALNEWEVLKEYPTLIEGLKASNPDLLPVLTKYGLLPTGASVGPVTVAGTVTGVIETLTDEAVTKIQKDPRAIIELVKQDIGNLMSRIYLSSLQLDSLHSTVPSDIAKNIKERITQFEEKLKATPDDSTLTSIYLREKESLEGFLSIVNDFVERMESKQIALDEKNIKKTEELIASIDKEQSFTTGEKALLSGAGLVFSGGAAVAASMIAGPVGTVVGLACILTNVATRTITTFSPASWKDVVSQVDKILDVSQENLNTTWALKNYDDLVPLLMNMEEALKIKEGFFLETEENLKDEQENFNKNLVGEIGKIEEANQPLYEEVWKAGSKYNDYTNAPYYNKDPENLTFLYEQLKAPLDSFTEETGKLKKMIEKGRKEITSNPSLTKDEKNNLLKEIKQQSDVMRGIKNQIDESIKVIKNIEEIKSELKKYTDHFPEEKSAIEELQNKLKQAVIASKDHGLKTSGFKGLSIQNQSGMADRKQEPNPFDNLDNQNQSTKVNKM